MADSGRQTPVIDIVQRDNDVLIRTEADLRPEDVRVDVHDGLLEVRVPKAALRMRPVPSRVPAPAQTGSERRVAGSATGPGGSGAPMSVPPPDVRRPGHGEDAEPPLSAPDEQDFWNAQKPLISEDRVTSVHLEGFTDEQANEILEVLGDDAPEEARGGSATGSDVFPAHGGFPSRNPEQEEPS